MQDIEPIYSIEFDDEDIHDFKRPWETSIGVSTSDIGFSDGTKWLWTEE